jgi:predicted membrane GTPase involved in stress response
VVSGLTARAAELRPRPHDLANARRWKAISEIDHDEMGEVTLKSIQSRKRFLDAQRHECALRAKMKN